MSEFSNNICFEIERTDKKIGDDVLKNKILACIQSASLSCPRGLTVDCSEMPEISEYVKTIRVEGTCQDISAMNAKFYFYKVNRRPVELETFENDAEEVPASNHWILPAEDFQGIWEHLIYEDGLKENLLKFMQTTMHFASRQVNPNIIACNKIVLLHGPPGTGKTSLCKALAQKLSIRLADVYKFTHLVEINSHSLFSKWFSESGKLVMKLFSKIKELVEHPKSLVCVLIDEVESIAYARSSVSSDEPRDALRVVNAVLTQLDQIQKYPNVLILTTSNLTSTIDLAFIDRADIKQFIGYPTVEAIYEIYCSAIKELKRVNILTNGTISTHSQLKNGVPNVHDATLLKIASKSQGLSGRTLRKIPFLAHSMLNDKCDTTLEDFLCVMWIAVDKYLKDQNALTASATTNRL